MTYIAARHSRVQGHLAVQDPFAVFWGLCAPKTCADGLSSTSTSIQRLMYKLVVDEVCPHEALCMFTATHQLILDVPDCDEAWDDSLVCTDPLPNQCGSCR